MSTLLFWLLIIFTWYTIGFISVILGNYWFLKRTKVIVEDLLHGICGPVFFIAFIYCGMISIIDSIKKINKDTILFDFGKKSKEKSLDN